MAGLASWRAFGEGIQDSQSETDSTLEQSNHLAVRGPGGVLSLYVAKALAGPPLDGTSHSGPSLNPSELRKSRTRSFDPSGEICKSATLTASVCT